jgi:hypothetical protein
MTTQTTISSVERILSRKQTVPSKLIHDLIVDCKALLALSTAQNKEIAKLKAQSKPETPSELSDWEDERLSRPTPY